MAKVLMINPRIREEDVPRHIPYGIALLASIAMNKGHQVSIYDENAWRKGDKVIKQACEADDWDVIAIGSLTTAYGSIKKILSIVKEVSPKAFIIAGGGFYTSMPHEMMEWLPIDLGIVGESFVTWPEVLEKIDRKDFDFSKTMGVCYCDKNGKSVLTPVRPNIHDLDTLPYPAWDLLPLEEVYFKNSSNLYSEAGYLAKRRIDINGSFGCSLVCKFCWHLGTTGDMLIEKNEQGDNDVRFTYGRNIRYHSPRYIVDMVKTLVKKYNVGFVSFLDENLMTMDQASGRTWLKELCDLWIKEGLQPTSRRDGVGDEKNEGGVFWSGTSHAGLARKETLELMYKAGCTHLVYGIESFDPVILKTLGKGVNQKQNLAAPKICMDTGIIPIPNIIIGFPDESFDSVRTTIHCIKELGIHAKPHFATPYPGSEWFYSYKDSIIEQYNGDLEAFILDLGDASKITATICHKFSAVQLVGLQKMVQDWNLRLLDLSEKHWAQADAVTKQIANPKSSFNVINKKIDGPIESKKDSVVAA